MTRILDSKKFQSKSTNAPIEFEHIGPHKSSGLYTRHLTLQGKAAYELSFSCGTCSFLFERLEGANSTVSVLEIDATLRDGIKSIDSQLLTLIAPILPQGNYVVNLLELTPELVAPLSSQDYFSHEQVSLWGLDPFWGLPHYPKTEYYRSHTENIGDNKALFEFVIPMTPKTWLKQETSEMFTRHIADGAKPTDLAIAVLDVKQPADWEGDPAINEHLCYAHFLLDGHHKMFAAHQLQKPIMLLSFLSVNECIAQTEQIERVQDLFSR
jgi:hypothetical protein